MKAREKIKPFYKLWREASEESKKKVLDRVQCISVEGHTYSGMNSYLLAMQTNGQGGVFGGFQQWRRQGRIVKKGSSGYGILYPTTIKDKDKDEEDTRFYTGVVFHESQTEEIKKIEEAECPKK